MATFAEFASQPQVRFLQPSKSTAAPKKREARLCLKSRYDCFIDWKIVRALNLPALTFNTESETGNLDGHHKSIYRGLPGLSKRSIGRVYPVVRTHTAYAAYIDYIPNAKITNKREECVILTTIPFRDTQQSGGKSWRRGTRYWRQPSQWHRSSIIPIKLNILTTALARS